MALPVVPATALRRVLGTVLILWLALAATAALAQTQQHIQASIVAKSDTPRPGATTRIAIRMTPESGWHGYWINPGDSGVPVEAEWHLPNGVRAGALEQPTPTLLELGGLASYVYEGAFTLLADLAVDRSVASGTALPVKVDLTWLACSDSLCVPERTTLQLALSAGDGAVDRSRQSLFSAAEAALPSSGRAQGRLEAADGRWAFVVSGARSLNVARTYLFPVEDGWFEASAKQHVTREADGTIRIEVAAPGSAPSPNFTGVISDGRQSFMLAGLKPDKAVAPASETATAEEAMVSGVPDPATGRETIGSAPESTAPSTGDAPALKIALMGALLGGLLLNLMPCVFPILSLKALSLARAGVDRRTARLEGVAYFAGSVVTSLLLGAILVGARALGHDIGWSFQLQNPHIILLLMLLSLMIALNLAGLFEMTGISVANRVMGKPGWSGAFGTGALAALVATPCSGPFMGVALGAALVLPTPAALAVFAGLGIGMALPFLLLAFVPALQRLLPKPGAWMETFRRLLAIPMLLPAQRSL